MDLWALTTVAKGALRRDRIGRNETIRDALGFFLVELREGWGCAPFRAVGDVEGETDLDGGAFGIGGGAGGRFGFGRDGFLGYGTLLFLQSRTR